MITEWSVLDHVLTDCWRVPMQVYSLRLQVPRRSVTIGHPPIDMRHVEASPVEEGGYGIVQLRNCRSSPLFLTTVS